MTTCRALDLSRLPSDTRLGTCILRPESTPMVGSPTASLSAKQKSRFAISVETQLKNVQDKSLFSYYIASIASFCTMQTQKINRAAQNSANIMHYSALRVQHNTTGLEGLRFPFSYQHILSTTFVTFTHKCKKFNRLLDFWLHIGLIWNTCHIFHTR